MKVVNLQLSLDLTGIPLTLRLNQIPMCLDKYMSLMGVNCRAAKHGGIDAKRFIVMSMQLVGDWALSKPSYLRER